MSNKESRPWDFLNPSTEYVPKNVQEDRYQICESCTLFNSILKKCTVCGCFMQLKTRLAHAYCPQAKWGSYSDEDNLKQ